MRTTYISNDTDLSRRTGVSEKKAKVCISRDTLTTRNALMMWTDLKGLECPLRPEDQSQGLRVIGRGLRPWPERTSGQALRSCLERAPFVIVKHRPFLTVIDCIPVTRPGCQSCDRLHPCHPSLLSVLCLMLGLVVNHSLSLVRWVGDLVCCM